MLTNCGFYGTRRNASLALYLKMLVLVTTISVGQISCLYLKEHNSIKISS